MRVRNQEPTLKIIQDKNSIAVKPQYSCLKGFDLKHPDNFDLNVIVSLSKYFNNVSLEYFSRILHSYSIEVLHLDIPQHQKHYYYRSCMNIYAACLYQMFSPRAKEELSDYIRKKKKFLNAKTKFHLLTNKTSSTSALGSTKTSTTASSVILSRSAITKKSTNTNNKLSERLQKRILASEPLLSDYKLLRYQSHVLGNIAEANILDYLFANYINTSKFVSNLNFISKCFVSSFDKADLIIKRNQKHQDHIIATADSVDCLSNSMVPIMMMNSINASSSTQEHILKMTPVNTDNFTAGSNSDGDDLDDILNNSQNSSRKNSKRPIIRQKIFKFISSKNNDLNIKENDNNDVSSVDSTQSESQFA